MNIPNGWYVVAATSELKDSPLALKCFGRGYVLWRDQSGRPTLMPDVCPHRSAKLSLGKVRGDCIQCPFHGFEFDAHGNCALVPEMGKPVISLEIPVGQVYEQNGFVWVWHGQKDPDKPPPWFEELDDSLAMAQSSHDWPTHITRCVENQLDYAHLPYVHRTTIGAKVNVRGKRRIECADGLITMCTNELKPDQVSIKFIFPNLWLLTISPGKFYQLIAFVPMSDDCTRLYLRAYQGFMTAPIISTLLKPLLNMSNARILNQDRSVVLSQEPRISVQATREILFQSDRAIHHFRRLWNEATTKE